MRLLRHLGAALTLAASMLAGSMAAYGQTNQGQIAGNVTDTTGAAVTSATVTAKSVENGTVYTAESTSAGSYRFPSIGLGHYNITVTAKGFKQVVNNGVEVRVGSVTSLDVALPAGGSTETVEVQADAPVVETQSSDVGGTVTSRQIVDLPLALGGVGAMRSPESFVFLVPGTVGPGSGNSNNGIFISKIGGGQNFSNEILLDGASQARSENGSSFDEEALSVEAIQEFKVTTSTPSAEFGRTSGGIENFVTKQGTNHYHGSAFGIFRNEFLDANDWFNNGKKAYYNSIGNTSQAASFKRPPDKQYDFGISAGGPAVIPHLYNGRDKTFAFFSWEQYRLTAGGVATSTVPTLAERGGDFSDQTIFGPNATGTNPPVNPCDGKVPLIGQIYDPATTATVGNTRCRSAFAGNKIPTQRFSTVGAKIAAFYPTPTNSGLRNNYVLASSSALFNTTYSIRVDQVLGKNDRLFGSYSTRENTRHSPTNQTLPFPVDPDVQTQDFITHFGRAGWDHNFTPNLLNHLNFGYNRSNSINGSLAADSGTNFNTQLGTPYLYGFPRVNADGYVSLSRNQFDDEVDNGIRVNDAVSWQKGRHNFKFGGDWRYQQFSPFAKAFFNGQINFSVNQTKAGQTGSFVNSTGNGFASELLGTGDYANSYIPSHQPRWISNYFAGFVQDDFKVTNSLVLNLGVRYDVDQPRREAQNNTSDFSLTAIDPKSGIPGALVFGTTCNNCNTRWADTYFKDIAPRVGFAFSPQSLNNKFVLRGGFAVLYAPLLYTDFGGSMTAGYTVPNPQTSNGFDPAFSVDGGLKPTVIGTNLDPGLYDSGDSNSPNFVNNYIKASYGRPPMVEQWNLQIQQELARDLIFTLGYTGTASAHLRSGIENINNIAKSNFGLGDQLSRPFAVTTQSTGAKVPYATFNTAATYQQALRPFPQYSYIATDCCLQNVGHSTYEALIASVDRRFSQGLSLTASYTWSKNITNADSALPGINAGVAQEQDPFDSKSQKTISIQDIPHTFVTSFLYELPFGKGKPWLAFKNPIARAMISGFEVGGVLRYQSGQPTSFGGANGIPGWDNFIEFTRLPNSSLKSNARKSGSIDPFRELRANFTLPGPDPRAGGDSEFNGLLRVDNAGYSALQSNPALYDQNNASNRVNRAIVNCLTPGAIVTPNCDNGGFQFGNVPRVTGEVRNYLYNNEDFSVLKRTPISEGVDFTVKMELLNAFNRHIFSTPDLQPYDQLFGVPTGTIDGPRKIQLTARFQF